jgi:hypothetical protein
VHKPWYFLCTKKYWCAETKNRRNSEDPITSA